MALVEKEKLFEEEFARSEKDPIGAGVEWLKTARQKGKEFFLEKGFPSIREEDWRFTDVSMLARTSFHLAEPARASVQDLKALDLPGMEARLVFVNGHYNGDLSSNVKNNSRVEIGNLRDLLEKSPDILKPFLGKRVHAESNTFAALNAAFFQDGVYLKIPKGVVLESPIEVLFYTKRPLEARMSHPRIVVIAEKDSQSSFVESYVGDGNFWTNVASEIYLEESARLTHYRIQRESLSSFHTSNIETVQQRHSYYESFNISFGGRLVRNNIRSVMEDEGAECHLNGLFMGVDQQHVDNHTVLDHAKSHCTSRENYRGILAGKARGVFNGEVVVRPDAQKTDSVQANNNLLISEEALMDTKPELRIFANDVKCKHGATIGQINPDMLFYLRSRGIPPKQARRLLTQAFATEIIDKIKPDLLREDLLKWVSDWVPA